MADVKRVLALTAIEAPFRGSLIRTQLLNPLCRAASQNGHWDVEYLALVPWSFHFGLRHPWSELAKNRAVIREITHTSFESGIAAHFRPILFPFLPRQFNLSAWNRRLFLACAWPMLVSFLLARLICGHKPDLIIARSYPAGLLARMALRMFGIPYLFDLRGMYPEECVNAGAFGPGSPDYNGWKLIERALISEAEACVVVSEPFAEHIRAIAPDTFPVVIPCCVDPRRYRYDPAKREQAKARFGLTGRFVLLHLGSFGATGDRELTGKYLLRFKQAEPSAILVVASGTPAYGPAIRAALLGEGLTPEDYRIVHPDQHEVGELLALGDAGLLLERKLPNTKACLSVKLGEYLASGLPVICTPFVEGAARLVKQYDCGLVVDPEGNDPMEKETSFLRDIGRLRENGFAVARSILSLDTCAGNWASTITAALTGTNKGRMHEG
jgi:glycosyltransferase involved in cell wall biosynthesis